MNPNLIEIAYILDRSGSMQSMQEPAITGYNDFIKQQLDVPGDARLTLVLFDNEYLVPYVARPVEQVPQLDASTYVPRGSTALLDAIGETIDTLGKRMAATPEEERPGKVIVAVFTDGEENSSERFAAKDIAARIKHQQEKYGWEFIFLAANQDAIATASRMNMAAHSSGNVRFCQEAIIGSNKAISRKISSMRRKSMGIHSEDFDASMSQLVQEETKAEEEKEKSNGKGAK